jgi:predicted methyltransferase
MKASHFAATAAIALLSGALAVRAADAIPSDVAAASIPPNVAAAVASPNRPAADTARDAARRPAEVLTFAGVKDGEQVLELIPGGATSRACSVARSDRAGMSPRQCR